MGVHDLWSILEPVRESVPLYSLGGKTLAVDLSLWVCEAQHVQAMMGRVTKPHLRNLFFRVSSLTLMGVKLVFVIEGEAPKIKAETMNQRNQTRYGGFKKAAACKVSSNPSRGRFKAVLRECAEMLDYLGVPWVSAAGEAEAMCAYLDSQGLVEGCITNDGDAFLYGARTVYRNFNMNSKDPQVDCYQTSHVQTELRLSREDLVGLAILLGCDYIPKGIPGVGREQALRLIQTLNGQSLLQRFKTWKREITPMSDGVVKKVSHCNICRHPGSAKTHERSGCMLCDSVRFCQPQDFDYQCPCDWHRHEQTRQASSFEANIRRKTLASEKFPFTEVISEFLVSKDKPVSHFKRRQPNMLLMQKFAYDKMEWPKHYTSVKVLILMSYTELINRKHGNGWTSQIKPIRILKPRVRNGIACFEVIWRTPEHFVFPEERPAEDQHEVRTVEEESLFCVAFPEVVDGYLRDKAEAEDNRTKKKKTKSKKEKPVEASEDGVSHLLAQMTLQSSSSTNSTTQPQTLLNSRSITDEPDVVILDSPVSQKQHRQKEADPDTPAPRADSQTVASPSVSVVIDALHLSDIDWDASSFTSSPSPQAAVSHTKEPETKKETTEPPTSSEVQHADSRCVPELCDTERSLMDRVLMRNTAKTTSQTEADKDTITRQFHGGLASFEHHSNSKPNAQIPSKSINQDQIKLKVSPVTKIEPFIDKIQCGTKKVEREARKTITEAESKRDQKSDAPKKPPHKYKFVRTAVSLSAAPSQRCNFVSARSDKKDVGVQPLTKSVCTSVCSSSDDSDTENHPTASRRGTKTKWIAPKKGASVSGFPLKLLPVPKTIKPHVKTTRSPLSIKANSRSLWGDAGEGAQASSDVPPAQADEDVFLQSPASPVVVSESDDSVICSESPLPLVERLRLKLMK